MASARIWGSGDVASRFQETISKAPGSSRGALLGGSVGLHDLRGSNACPVWKNHGSPARAVAWLAAERPTARTCCRRGEMARCLGKNYFLGKNERRAILGNNKEELFLKNEEEFFLGKNEESVQVCKWCFARGIRTPRKVPVGN